jgi:hypothetical protein
VDPRLAELLLRKSELVASFPEWMLPEETAARLRGSSNTAIVEIAGRDSVAAALRAASETPYELLLPTIAYTGTEFGDWRLPFDKVDFLRERLAAAAVETELLPPVVLGAPELWHLLNGRFVAALSRRFGFYTPCLGCHLYLHALRLPLARMTGCETIVAGERESHDGRVKLNQIPEALEAYVAFARDFGVELALPLRYVTSGSEIDDLLGGQWPEGEGQLRCVLSGNYRDAAGDVAYDAAAVRAYFYEFALAAARRAVEAYLAGERPDYGRLAADLWPNS